MPLRVVARSPSPRFVVGGAHFQLPRTSIWVHSPATLHLPPQASLPTTTTQTDLIRLHSSLYSKISPIRQSPNPRPTVPPPMPHSRRLEATKIQLTTTSYAHNKNRFLSR